LLSVDNEPRVLDVALAEQLEMARPTNIRALIESSLEELEGFGHVARSECNVPMPRGRFKKSTAFCLNRQQALLVCILSRMERAKEVGAEVIRRFARAWSPLVAGSARESLRASQGPCEAF